MSIENHREARSRHINIITIKYRTILYRSTDMNKNLKIIKLNQIRKKQKIKNPYKLVLAEKFSFIFYFICIASLQLLF